MGHWFDHFSFTAGAAHVFWSVIILAVARVFVWIWKKRFDRKRELAFWATGIVGLSTLFIYASNLARWSPEKYPDFRPRILFINIGDTSNHTNSLGQEQVCVFVGLTIHNRGAQSVIRDWALDIETSTSGKLAAKLLPAPLKDLHIISQRGQPDIVLPKGLCLAEKCRHDPLERGKMVEGYLQFLVPNVDRALLQNPGTKYKLTFSDTEDRVYSLEQAIPGQVGFY
jgi:hypothetical protein